MGAERLVVLNKDRELEILKEKINILESVIEYSTAETLKGLREKLQTLEKEVIQLRVKDSEKDRLIAEKEKRITDLQNNFNHQLNAQLQLQRNQFEAEKKQSLSDQRKNIRSKEVKPEREKAEQAREEVDRIQNMYNQLLNEFKLSHRNEEAIIGLCSDILSTVKQLVLNGNTSEEIIEKIDTGVETLQTYTIKEECEIIHNMLENKYSKKEIANILYPDLKRKEQKVQDRINSKTYRDMYDIP